MNKEKGYFIVMMFFIMVVLTALAATYSAFIIKQLEFARQLENDIKLRHIAESGIRYAKYNLSHDTSFRKSQKPVSCGEGEFFIQVLPKGEYYIIKSKAHLGKLEKDIEYLYKK